jgi:hypothetical protein
VHWSITACGLTALHFGERPHTALANLTPAAYKAKELEKLRLALDG